MWILNTMIPHFSQSHVLSPHVIAVHTAACLVKNNSLDYAITHKSLQQRDHFLSRLSSGQVWGCLIMNNNSTYIETSYKDKPELLSLCLCVSIGKAQHAVTMPGKNKLGYVRRISRATKLNAISFFIPFSSHLSVFYENT